MFFGKLIIWVGNHMNRSLTASEARTQTNKCIQIDVSKYINTINVRIDLASHKQQFEIFAINRHHYINNKDKQTISNQHMELIAQHYTTLGYKCRRFGFSFYNDWSLSWETS